MIRPTPHLATLGLAAALAGGCSSSDLSDADREALVGALRDEGMPPVEYVLSKFEDHDMVILGEHGLVAQDVAFVVRLIPRLHEAGVRVLALEYATAEDQLAIDSLVTNLQYDAAKALEIQRRYSGGIWPYREYLDIYQAAWDVNRKRAQGTEPFRIVGISPAIDWEAINYGDDDEAQRQRDVLAATEQYMAAATERLSSAIDEKALVYCAMRRAFTDYKPPVVADGDVAGEAMRMGNILAERLGPRVCTVALHAPWPGTDRGTLVSPCQGKIDAAVAAFGDSVGLDVDRTAFAELEETRAVYAAGHDEGVSLARLVDGYVAHGPIATLTGVTVIQSWITGEQDLARAKRRFPDRAQAQRFSTIRDVLDAFQRDAALGRRFEHAR